MIGEHKVRIEAFTDESKGHWTKEITLTFIPTKGISVELETELGPLMLRWRDTDEIVFKHSEQVFVITHYFRPLYGMKFKGTDTFIPNTKILEAAGFREQRKD